jgi:hypothetical protein
VAVAKEQPVGLPVQRLITVTLDFSPTGDEATVQGPFVPPDTTSSLDFSDPANSELLPAI